MTAACVWRMSTILTSFLSFYSICFLDGTSRQPQGRFCVVVTLFLVLALWPLAFFRTLKMSSATAVSRSYWQTQICLVRAIACWCVRCANEPCFVSSLCFSLFNRTLHFCSHVIRLKVISHDCRRLLFTEKIHSSCIYSVSLLLQLVLKSVAFCVAVSFNRYGVCNL